MSEALLSGTALTGGDTGPEVTLLGEGRMVGEDCWREVHRLFHVERRSKSEIARDLNLDRKTVRGILQAATWQPYTRAELLTKVRSALRHPAESGSLIVERRKRRP